MRRLPVLLLPLTLACSLVAPLSPSPPPFFREPFMIETSDHSVLTWGALGPKCDL